ncbi:MAG TPA: glycoside hydrolase family 20 zincin-like fold domain-containing protein, partial [Puia sp.]|nr:glycoside hydrolase family 20 zincin-like fold domain-containing protein [Puia sp.]
MLKQFLVLVVNLLTVSVMAQTVLLPAPRHVVYGKGELRLSKLSVVVPAGAPKDVVFALKELRGIVGAAMGDGGAVGAGGANFKYVLGGAGNREWYKLRIDARGVSVEATGSAGLYYAVQTI